MVDYRHWSLAYLMYMIPPLVLMFPIYLVIDALVGGQVAVTYMGVAYLLAAGVVLLYRVAASHAHHELWREGGAAVTAVILFMVFTHIWMLAGVASTGYLIYDRFSGSSKKRQREPRQRQNPSRSPQRQPRPRQRNQR